MNSKSRNGYSIVECLVVMGIASIFFIFCTRYLTTVLRSETHGARSLMRTRTLDKLAHQFRDDIHQARNVTHQPSTENTNEELRLTTENETTSPEVTIVYRVDENKVIRELRSESDVRGSETFQLDNTKLSFALDDHRAQASLVLYSKQGLNTKAPQQTGSESEIEYRIEAAIGHQYRFAPNSSNGAQPAASSATEDNT